jgi:hypothetical protein
VLSIYVYAEQGLWLTAVMYFVLLVNVVFGWEAWRKAFLKQADRLAVTA